MQAPARCSLVAISPVARASPVPRLSMPPPCCCSVAAEEEESAMADRRQDLFTLFRNAANLARPEAYRFVGGLLGAALSGGGGGSASWQVRACVEGGQAGAGRPAVVHPAAPCVRRPRDCTLAICHASSEGHLSISKPSSLAPSLFRCGQDVEVSVTLLYQLGEGAPEGDMRPGSGVLAQLAAGVMQVLQQGLRSCPAPLGSAGWSAVEDESPAACVCQPPGALAPALSKLTCCCQTPPPRPSPFCQAESPASKHRLVALALLETYVRYSRVLAAGGGAALPAVDARFLDEHGMGHSSEAVSKRAAYLFCRLAKQLRANLRPLLPDILQARAGRWDPVAAWTTVGSMRSAGPRLCSASSPTWQPSRPPPPKRHPPPRAPA